ncbi:hypothetical protein C1645_827215 [Glomus cerebriforme]|uniref:Galactose oxidase n=1 Tax=Glomus cerebriforme TaxID=658196 RepID=A0A397SNR1_9GLOM|nr:hypothetical protein C1645_827215 [Glomus cerebriforme]
MSKSFLGCFILWILFQLLIEVNCQMTPFKPNVLYKHTATFVDNKLYILGGKDINENYVGKEFFYLDVSVPFNTQNLLWQDLSNINMLPPHSSAASVKGGVNNDTLFLYGGITNDQTMALVYTFDPQSNSWAIPKIAGVNPFRKARLTGVNHDGKMYLWSGTTILDNYVFVNDMLILDTINLSWGKGSLVNAPTPRGHYGAALLPNNNIIYIGGYDDITVGFNDNLYINKGNALTLIEVYMYDIMNDNWSTKMTTGNIPSNRADFSTVLGLDGQRIIIFGGGFINPGYLDTTLYELDLINFVWTIPKVTGKIPTPRILHKANVIGKYMVISFGYGYDQSIESDILLLDISNNEEYVWTTTFDPTIPNNTNNTTSTSSSSSNSSNNTGAIVGSLFGGILFSFGVYLLYKWNKNKKKQKDEGYGQEERTISTTKNIHNYVNNNYNNHEITQVPINGNSTNNKPIIIPTPVINKNCGQEIIHDENTTNHEPIIPAPEVNRNYNHGEVTSTLDNDKLQIFKDEILQAVDQKLKNFNNSNITRNDES